MLVMNQVGMENMTSQSLMQRRQPHQSMDPINIQELQVGINRKKVLNDLGYGRWLQNYGGKHTRAFHGSNGHWEKVAGSKFDVAQNSQILDALSSLRLEEKYKVKCYFYLNDNPSKVALLMVAPGEIEEHFLKKVWLRQEMGNDRLLDSQSTRTLYV